MTPPRLDTFLERDAGDDFDDLGLVAALLLLMGEDGSSVVSGESSAVEDWGMEVDASAAASGVAAAPVVAVSSDSSTTLVTNSSSISASVDVTGSTAVASGLGVSVEGLISIVVDDVGDTAALSASVIAVFVVSAAAGEENSSLLLASS